MNIWTCGMVIGMPDEDALFEAFKAGFELSAEGRNGEWGHPGDETLREEFEHWNCDHEFTDWKPILTNFRINGEYNHKRECVHCGFRETEYRELSDT